MKTHIHESHINVASAAAEGVLYRVRRFSLGRRIELMRRIHELSQKIEFLQAGAGEREQIEALWLAGEVDAIYLRWGLAAVEGLEIDGQMATVESFVECGPEALAREALTAVKAEMGLSEEARKN